MSASTNSLSASHPSPSLSDVTTSVCPASSKNFLSPSSPDTHPSSSPGVKSIAFGDGKVMPSGYLSIFGKSSLAYLLGIPFFGSSYKTHNIFIISPFM